MGKWKTTLALVSLALAAACAQTVRVREGASTPAAKAEAKVSQDKNGNNVLDLRVQYMAPPDRLTPPKNFYQVWAELPDGSVNALGRLMVGEDREGRFVATVPYPVFKILVTGENEFVPGVPTRPAVLSTGMLRPDN